MLFQFILALSIGKKYLRELSNLIFQVILLFSYFNMNRQELPRIRLKVVTNAGINILCTALRTWKVIEWLPHIEQAYREVKEDQEDDEGSKQRFIRAIRIKKEEFYIANSEYIGDIFEDNDEVQCEISFPQIINKSHKKEKHKDKSKEKREITRQTGEIPIVDEKKELKKITSDVVEEDIEPKPKKRVKTDKHQKKQTEKNEQQQQKPSQKNKTDRENQPEKRQSQSKNKNHKSLQEKEEKKHKQEQIMKNVDLAKLKSRIKPPVQISDVNPLTGKVLKIYSVNDDSNSEESS